MDQADYFYFVTILCFIFFYFFEYRHSEDLIPLEIFFFFFVATFQNMIKLYIGNLSPSVTVEDLKQLFRERNLPVPEQVLLKSGYAFVDFPDQNSAIKAIETLSGKCGFDK